MLYSALKLDFVFSLEKEDFFCIPLEMFFILVSIAFFLLFTDKNSLLNMILNRRQEEDSEASGT